ncbi:unnamed protein product, partial [Discosporangium mesarthrocarpum]
IHYAPENDTVAVIEPFSRSFRVYHAGSMQLKRQYAPKVPAGFVRSVCYDDVIGCYVVATSAMHMSLLDEDTGNTLKSFRTRSNQVCMAHARGGGSSYVITGDIQGNIRSWNLDTIQDTDNRLALSHTEFGTPPPPKRSESGAKQGLGGGHTDVVLNLLTLQDHGLLASCSMDHTVKLWDLSTHRLKNTLQGVRHMAYCPEYRLVVSGGFCYDILVSNPYVSKPINRLHGHCAPIVGVEIPPNSPQAGRLITADEDGMCKLWDLRNFSCVQTFSPHTDVRKTR